MLKRMLYTSLVLSSLILAANCSKSKSNTGGGGTTDTTTTPVVLSDKILSSGLTMPWDLVWAPDNTIWFTQKSGIISKVDPANGSVSNLLTISDVVVRGEGGLLGMAFHPSFASNPYLYVVYDYLKGSAYREKVVRYTVSGNNLSSPTIIFDNIIADNNHNGSRLVIVGDKLFISTGDAVETSYPQDPNSVNGKILRINLDGSIPSDNPVSGNPYWSFGHRNPQGLVYANGILYSSEHGPNNDDEINIIEKGRNYGWPTVMGFCDNSSETAFCSSNNVKEPIKAWTPTIATCGLDYYNNAKIPQWKNSLLLATLKNSRLYQLKLNATFNAVTETNEFYNGKFGRLRDVLVAPTGKVYLCTSNGSDDKIIEISAP